MNLLPYHTQAEARLAAGPLPGPYADVRPYEAAELKQPDRPLTVAYAYVDHGDQQWQTMIKGMQLSVATVYRDATIANLPFMVDRKDFVRAYLQIYSKMRRSLRGPMIFIDGDVVANRDARHVFDEDFDVALTDSPVAYPLMPFNAGVMFMKDTPGAQLYMDRVMELANQQPNESYWFINQIAMYTAYLQLKGQVKFLILPWQQYNFVPDTVLDDTDAYFVHLKGNRKGMYVDYLRLSMERHGNLKAMALPADKLEMEDPTPDPIGLLEIKPNIVTNRARGLPRWERRDVTGEVAIVGYGPSLREEWVRLKDFKGEIWTVGKAHDFLVERGIRPHTHVDLDYREHKATFNKLETSETRVILATQIHPKYIDRLLAQGVTPQLFWSDVPGAEPSKGYPRSAAQYDAGMQAAMLAYREGLTDQLWIGIDASALGRETHAGPHGGMRSVKAEVMVGDRMYHTTSLLLREALFAERLLRQFSGMKVRIAGDGMLRPFLLSRGRVINVSAA